MAYLLLCHDKAEIFVEIWRNVCYSTYVREHHHERAEKKIKEYNPQHIFSKWLIEHRKNLQENAPGLYNDLLDAMQSKKIENINKILDKLKKFKVISFNINDDIYLDEDDFDSSKWLDE